MQSLAIEVKQLSKRYGSHYALDQVSFQVNIGEIVALLGANGAGKSTLLQILSGLVSPSGGEATVLGTDVQKNTMGLKKKIGLLFGNDTGLYLRLTAYENIAFFADLYGVEKGKYENRLRDWADRLELTPHLKKRAGQLSKGNLQKVAIIRALIHDPEVIFFDEPTTGLDIAASLAFQDLVKELQQQGKTILFATHILEEVTNLARRVLILKQGKLVEDGSLDSLYEKYQTRHLGQILRQWIGGKEQ